MKNNTKILVEPKKHINETWCECIECEIIEFNGGRPTTEEFIDIEKNFHNQF